jgi:peptidoglycan/xylan/chitin deacetylase (PgdA/CDA1 family)
MYDPYSYPRCFHRQCSLSLILLLLLVSLFLPSQPVLANTHNNAGTTTAITLSTLGSVPLALVPHLGSIADSANETIVWSPQLFPQDSSRSSISGENIGSMETPLITEPSEVVAQVYLPLVRKQTWTPGTIRTEEHATTTSATNLRSGPGTNYPTQLIIPAGSQVYINSGPYNNVWYDTTYNHIRGYLHGDYLAQAPARTITKLNTARKVVALTFDAGADTGYAAQILDTLGAQGVKASFGITGQWAEENPALIKRIVEEGHTLINHTYTHRSFTGFSTGRPPLNPNQRVEELWKTESAIAQITGASTQPYFRPPYGDYDNSVLLDIRSQGYTYNIMWSVDSLGWRGLTKEQIVQRCLNGLEPGAIYLFHVGSSAQDGPALPDIIRELRARGYSFATIADFYR